MPCKEVAKLHGVTPSNIYKRSTRFGWSKAASPAKVKARQAVHHAVRQAVALATRKVEPAIHEEVRKWQERIKATGSTVVGHVDAKLSNPNQDTKDLKELASTADIAGRMVRRSLGLDQSGPGSSDQPVRVAVAIRLESLGLSEDTVRANGTGPTGTTGYHRTKWLAEGAVRASGLDWTIFRPSLIFGPGGEFVNMLADLIRKTPVVPVIGDGQYRMQPVAVEQVAASFVRALAMPETIGQCYLLGGGASYSYDEILDLTAKAIGRDHVTKAHQPLFMVKPMIKLMEHSEHFPITSEQVEMLLAGNVCDIAAWTKAFGIAPLSYAEGIGGCFHEG